MQLERGVAGLLLVRVGSDTGPDLGAVAQADDDVEVVVKADHAVVGQVGLACEAEVVLQGRQVIRNEPQHSDQWGVYAVFGGGRPWLIRCITAMMVALAG